MSTIRSLSATADPANLTQRVGPPIRADYLSDVMSRPAVSKQQMTLTLFAWPIAIGLGWAIARATQTHWPAAALPAAWVGLLFVTLKRYAATER